MEKKRNQANWEKFCNLHKLQLVDFQQLMLSTTNNLAKLEDVLVQCLCHNKKNVTKPESKRRIQSAECEQYACSREIQQQNATQSACPT